MCTEIYRMKQMTTREQPLTKASCRHSGLTVGFTFFTLLPLDGQEVKGAAITGSVEEK